MPSLCVSQMGDPSWPLNMVPWTPSYFGTGIMGIRHWSGALGFMSCRLCELDKWVRLSFLSRKCLPKCLPKESSWRLNGASIGKLLANYKEFYKCRGLCFVGYLGLFLVSALPPFLASSPLEFFHNCPEVSLNSHLLPPCLALSLFEIH